MTERGIIFSTAMVQALLDGRKTQTRRLLTPQPDKTDAAGKRIDYVGDYCTGAPQHGQAYYWRENGGWNSSQRFYLPYGAGDSLYVREAWSVRGVYSDVVEVGYRASENRRHTEYVEQWPVAQAVPGKGMWPEWPKYGPSIHMPRWASRLWLAVTDVRVQRLQECSEDDAIAEGIEGFACIGGQAWRDYGGGSGFNKTDPVTPATRSYSTLWNSLHTAEGERWEDNPWIVAVTFDVHRGNIDAVTG